MCMSLFNFLPLRTILRGMADMSNSMKEWLRSGYFNEVEDLEGKVEASNDILKILSLMSGSRNAFILAFLLSTLWT